MAGRMHILMTRGGPEKQAMFKGAASSAEIPPRLQGFYSSEQSTAETGSRSLSSESSGLGYGRHNRAGASLLAQITRCQVVVWSQSGGPRGVG